MLIALSAVVLFLTGALAGNLDATRRRDKWVAGLPEDLRDVVSGALREYPLR